MFLDENLVENRFLGSKKLDPDFSTNIMVEN
jgi:hypothetical protein